MREPIEERGGQFLIASKHRDPFSKGEIRRDDGRATLVAVGEQIEEELAPVSIERNEAELVDLCGPPHKSTNATPAVMWSEAATTSVKRTATGIPTPHYW